MEITFGIMESTVIQVAGGTEIVKIIGTVTLNANKKVTNSNGRFETIDGLSLGTYNMYSENQYSYNLNNKDLSCDCINALHEFISEIEIQSTAVSLTV